MDHKPRVLIVDDQLSARQTLEALLSEEGYELFFAANGVEALAAAQEIEPDVILLDVMMPVMNGFQVCQRLRANPRLAEVPVIMITALDDHEARLQGFEMGADDFLNKPFDRAELRARVRTIVRLNRYRLIEQSRRELQRPLTTILTLARELDHAYDRLSDEARRRLAREIHLQAAALSDPKGRQDLP